MICAAASARTTPSGETVTARYAVPRAAASPARVRPTFSLDGHIRLRDGRVREGLGVLAGQKEAEIVGYGVDLPPDGGRDLPAARGAKALLDCRHADRGNR